MILLFATTVGYWGLMCRNAQNVNQNNGYYRLVLIEVIPFPTLINAPLRCS